MNKKKCKSVEYEGKDLENLNIDLDLRPDQLSSKKFLELTKLMKKYG